MYARQVFHAEPAQPHPITGSPQSWDLQVVGFEDLTLGGHRYRGCVRYRLRVQDTLSGARTGDAVIVLAPGIGPVQVRGYLMGVGVDLRLREVLWPWAGEASS